MFILHLCTTRRTRQDDSDGRSKNRVVSLCCAPRTVIEKPGRSGIYEFGTRDSFEPHTPCVSAFTVAIVSSLYSFDAWGPNKMLYSYAR